MPHILLADDYPDALDMYAQLLRSEGLQVTTACDGSTAIEAARRQRFDLILLDLSMPGVHGLEVVRRLKADSPFTHGPIVALTAHAYASDRAKAEQAGFDGFLAKPILPLDLVAVVRRLLAGGGRTDSA